MRKAFLPTLLVSALAMAALCGPTAAAAPPSSNSAINEYQESLPGPGGGQPSNGGNRGGGGNQGANQTGSSNNPSGNGSSGGGSSGSGSSASSPLPAQAVRQLAAHGASGKALSDLAQKTGSAAGSRSGKGSDTAAGSGAGGGDSSGFFDSVGGALSDFIRGSDTGLGAGFPILLVAILVGAIAVILSRNRRGVGPHAGGGLP